MPCFLMVVYDCKKLIIFMVACALRSSPSQSLSIVIEGGNLLPPGPGHETSYVSLSLNFARDTLFGVLLLAAQQFSTGLGLRASCQHAAEKALGGGRSRDYRPPPFAFPIYTRTHP
jgi:hypothetical protein